MNNQRLVTNNHSNGVQLHLHNLFKGIGEVVNLYSPGT
jgi:hypothetical protein